MMISAVVLVNTEINAQDHVAESLKQVDGIEEAHALFGMYDVLVRIRASSVEALKDVTKSHIRPLSGVTNSLTLMIVNNPAAVEDSTQDRKSKNRLLTITKRKN